MNTAVPSVAIIGGGWAGLSCACYLRSCGIYSVLYEASPSLGGRARSVVMNDMTVDNGQHVMIGAYREMLNLFELIGVDVAQHIHRQPFEWHMLGANSLSIKRFLPSLQASFALSRSLSVADKLSLARLFKLVQRHQFQWPADEAFIHLLKNTKATSRLIDCFWRPLVLGALCTPLEDASAQVVLNVLKQSFGEHSSSSDWLIPKTDLTQLFIKPALRYMASHCQVLLKQRAQSIRQNHKERFEVDRVASSRCYSHVVVAASQLETRRILANMDIDIPRFQSQGIVTVYLQYEVQCFMKRVISGVVDGMAHWYIDRRITGQNGLIAAVISGDGPYLTMPKSQLLEIIDREIRHYYPKWPVFKSGWVIKEKRAAFYCDVKNHDLRPTYKTDYDGLWLAGDYVQTGLPATLESAILSGRLCAESIAAQLKQ